MPVNYEQLSQQLHKTGKALLSRQAAAREMSAVCYEALRREGDSPDFAERVDSALENRPETRCALPGEEPIHASFPRPAVPETPVRLLACDGSQIAPSRHDEVSLTLINIAVVEYIRRSGQTPRIMTRTELLDPGDQPGEELLAVRRDVAEKQMLAEMAAEADPSIPTLALCDGPLELFTETTEMREQQVLKLRYLEALSRLQRSGVPAAGYTDRPRSDPVLRMLLLTMEDAPQEKTDGDDGMLFAHLLAPGARSAVFRLNSRLNRELDEQKQLCFFYLNIGRPGSPYISRVDLPVWALPSVDLLHGMLLEQNELLGGHPYPFILHRAHESAVVTLQEKEQIKELLLREIGSSGGAYPEKSNKQIAKDLCRLP